MKTQWQYNFHLQLITANLTKQGLSQAMLTICSNSTNHVTPLSLWPWCNSKNVSCALQNKKTTLNSCKTIWNFSNFWFHHWKKISHSFYFNLQHTIHEETENPPLVKHKRRIAPQPFDDKVQNNPDYHTPADPGSYSKFLSLDSFQGLSQGDANNGSKNVSCILLSSLDYFAGNLIQTKYWQQVHKQFGNCPHTHRQEVLHCNQLCHHGLSWLLGLPACRWR